MQSAYAPRRQPREGAPAPSTRMGKWNGRIGGGLGSGNGAMDGTRTHDHSDHNRGLYQLSYHRHRGTEYPSVNPSPIGLSGATPAGTSDRTQASADEGYWGDGWDSSPRPLGPQPRALPTELPSPQRGRLFAPRDPSGQVLISCCEKSASTPSEAGQFNSGAPDGSNSGLGVRGESFASGLWLGA